MTDTKFYSSKSNALRAFRQQNTTFAAGMTSDQIVEAGYVDQDEPGKWVVNDPALITKRDEDEAEQARADAEHAKRQKAKDAEKERQAQAERDAEANHPMFRPQQTATPAVKPNVVTGKRAPSGTSDGLKIEANRLTANGVTRPSVGGKCRAVWDMLDGEGRGVTAVRAREVAGERGFDKTTTMVQFYKWRKFNGIAGRQ